MRGEGASQKQGGAGRFGKRQKEESPGLAVRNLLPTSHFSGLRILRLKESPGLTFIELLVTVAIIAWLWIVMVGVFGTKMQRARAIACDYQVKLINSKLDVLEHMKGKKITSQKELEAILHDPDQFQSPPVCPFGAPYTINPKTGLVFFHHHAHR